MKAAVNRVVSILSGAGYRIVAMPMTVANVTFEFPAALIGTGYSQDLIIVMDLSADVETANSTEDRSAGERSGRGTVEAAAHRRANRPTPEPTHARSFDLGMPRIADESRAV